MSENVFESRRVVRAYRQTIEATPEVVVPLLCPVREAEWLDGWTYRMIYSVSGLAEEGAVFSTANEGEANTVWVVTRHDHAAGAVEFTRFTPDSRTCVLTIGVAKNGIAGSHVDVRYAYTSIAPAGNVFLDAWTEEAFRKAMIFWEQSMNYFLKTGRQLSHAASQ